MAGGSDLGISRAAVHAQRYVYVCEDDDETYEWDEQASKEAADYPVGAPDTAVLGRRCFKKAAELGPGCVRGQTVCFPVTAWGEPSGLPDGVPRTGCISRGDVLDIWQQVRARARPAADLLVASFIWGWGTVGYGPRRLRDIRAAAGNQLEPSLQRALDAVNMDPDPPHPVAGYACLYDGNDDQDRAAPGQEPWSRLRGFGPAFFTKFLYFSTPGALILDNQLANAVHQLSQLPHLVARNRQSLVWTPYCYSVYLHWMAQTARAVGVEPELLELTLFQPPGDLADENGRWRVLGAYDTTSALGVLAEAGLLSGDPSCAGRDAANRCRRGSLEARLRHAELIRVLL